MKIIALILALSSSVAIAQTPCGAHATGKRADGSTWTGAAARMWVDKDGWWRVCQPWVPDGGDPTMPEPKAVPCVGRDTYEEWEDGDAICSSLPPGAYTGTTSRLTFAEDGRARLIRDEWGIFQGMAIFRCTRGKWVKEAAFCKRAQ